MISLIKKVNRKIIDHGLQTRLITYTVILLSLLMLVTTILGIKRESQSIFKQMQKDGIALAKAYALGAENALLLQRAGLSRVAGEAGRTKGILYLQIVDKDLVVIGHTDISKMGIEIEDSLYNRALKTHITAVEEGDTPINLIQTNSDGKKVFRVIVPLVTLNKVGGVLEIGLDMAGIDRAVKRTNTQSRLIALVALLVYVVCIWLFARSFVHPIRNFAEAAGKVAAGDLDQKIEINASDEIGQLASSFNFMTEKLRESMGNLKKTNEDLESHVAMIENLRIYIENIFNSITVGILTIDLQSKITYVNSTGAGILQLEKKSIIDRSIGQVFKEDHFIHVAFAKMKDTNHMYQGHEVKLKKSSGSDMLLSVTIVSLFDQHAKVVGYAVTFEDVTEIRQLQGKIQHSEKMVAMGRLAAGIAHEIRNPLGAVKTCAQYLESNSGADDPNFKFSQLIVREVKRVDQLVERLLNFTRPTDWDFQYEDINKLIENAVDLATLKINGADITIEKRYADDLPKIFVDAKRISMAVFNILLNAIDAIDTSGEMKIGTKFNENDNAIIITISDSGKGIAKEEMENIFNPFFTTRPGGTGLGLAIVQQIIVEHNGTINVTSTPGKGTGFKILLPVDQENRPVKNSEVFI